MSHSKTSEKGKVFLNNIVATETGDVLFMNRKCFSMKDIPSATLCLLAKTESRFDHVGMVLKMKEDDYQKYPLIRESIPSLSPSGTYLVETNMKGVTVISVEERLRRTSSNEVAFAPLILKDSQEAQQIRNKIPLFVERLVKTPYPKDAQHFFPSIFSPPDKSDRIQAAQIIQRLEEEVAFCNQYAKNCPSIKESLQKVVQNLESTRENLLHTYFSRFISENFVRQLPSGKLVWLSSPYKVDGENLSDKMVCSELISNIWTEVGITNGFIPASSQRPFDFLDASRLNFTRSDSLLGPLVPLKVQNSHVCFWEENTGNSTEDSKHPFVIGDRTNDTSEMTFSTSSTFKEGIPFVKEKIAKVSNVETSFSCSSELVPDSSVMADHLALSAPANQLSKLPYRLFYSASLFSFLQFGCAPWTIRWFEAQAGFFMVRGGIWSLATGLLLRNLSCAVVQSSILAYVLSKYDVQNAKILFNDPIFRQAEYWVDTRHPFYLSAVSLWMSFAIASLVTIPIANANIFRHFVRSQPGPISAHFFWSGSLSLLPFSILAPYQAFWLSWYETLGVMLYPVSSTVLRPHKSSLSQENESQRKKKALISAVTITIGLDALVYPVETLVIRKVIRSIYGNKFPTKRYGGHRLYAGYRYRFLSTAVITIMSSAALQTLKLI